MDSKYTRDYVNHFDPAAYLKAYNSDVYGDPSEGDMMPKEMQFLHEAFSHNDIEGRRLLDIGTGPTIHTVISASRHVDSIFLSDFAPKNIETLKEWLNGTLQHSFESFFKYVVEVEGIGESPSDRETFLRTKVSAICSIDLLQGYPLAPSYFPPFDVITSGLCLEAVAEDLVAYETIAKRVADLLVDGGHLVLFGVLGEKFYQVGGHLFRCLEIDGKQAQDIWKRCGFEIVDWKQRSHSTPGDKSASDFSGYFLMIAKKVKPVL